VPGKCQVNYSSFLIGGKRCQAKIWTKARKFGGELVVVVKIEQDYTCPLF
jgi:hypothetical protein